MSINRALIEPYKNLELLAKQVVEGFITGMHKSPFHGFSVEFAEHRLYNKGESIKHIDWKLFARTEKLFIKRYEEETNLRCQIVIDTSSSMLFPKDKTENKLTFSVYAAAALCELLKQQRDAYGLTLFNETIEQHLGAKGNPAHFQLIFNQLNNLLETRTENLNSNPSLALNQIAEVVHQRSLIVIFSDMFDSATDEEKLYSALQHLKYKKHEVVLFHVTDKGKEINFEFENKPYHFIDIETGEELKLNPTQIKEKYAQQLTTYVEKIKTKCGQFNIDFVEADISAGFDTILRTYFAKRTLMIR